MKKMRFLLKKILLIVIVNFSVFAVGAMYDASKSRIFDVMYQGPGGIEKVNKKVVFAEVKNIAQDLNLDEIARRFGCKTKLGQAFILCNLKKPISPYDQSLILQHRQKLIKFLVENQEILEQLRSLILQAVEEESVVIQFMQNRLVNSPTENPLVKFFRWMDRSPSMSTYNKYTQLMSFVRAQVPSVFYDGINVFNSAFQDVSFSQRILLLGSGLLSLSSSKQLTDEHKFVSGLYSTLTTGYALYSHYSGALATRKALHSLYQLINISKQIEDLCLQLGVEHQFKVSSIQSEKGQELLDGLNQARYKDKDTNFVMSTLVNSFMYDVYEYDIHLAPVYASIAEIDAYVAFAQKIIELQAHGDHQICFVEFLDDSQPVVKAKAFWNLLVSKGKVVVNDLSESRNIILTGANEGGKTTTIRAILQNIILAQTFGIAAADEFVLTPFTKIHSYLNVSDDILSGKSRYAFELQQAKSILDQIEALRSEDKFFFVLDELFTGTNGEDGAQAAYDFIDNIASFPKIQFIYATHFNRLKQIGHANPACANYKIEPPLRDEKGQFIRDEQGEFIYPYKLSLGANSVNVALERAKDAGIFKKKRP